MQTTARHLACSSLMIALASACGAAPDTVGPVGRAGADPGDDIADVIDDDGDGLDAFPIDGLGGGTRTVASVCQVTEEPELARIMASAHGLIITTDVVRGWSTVLSLSGQGCALEPKPLVGEVSSQLLLDMDDSGALYTASDGYWNAVTRTSVNGDEDVVVSAGRGIWSFGISADGGRFVSSACGPTGVFDSDDATYAPLYDIVAEGSVLVDGGDAAIRVDAYQGELTRTNDSGSSVVFGVNVVGAGLQRCGDAACVVLDGAIVVVDGSDHFVVDTDVLDLEDGDAIVSVAAADHHQGLYLLISGMSYLDRVVYMAFAD